MKEIISGKLKRMIGELFLAGCLTFSGCVVANTTPITPPPAENQTKIEQTITPKHLNLDERVSMIEKIINDDYPCYTIVKNHDYVIVNTPSKLHDNYICYIDQERKLSSNALQTIYAEPGRTSNVVVMSGPDEDNNGLPDNKTLIRMYDALKDKISDNVTSDLSIYNNSPLNALNNILQTNEREEKAFEKIINNYLKQTDRPRILVDKDFQAIKELYCEDETLVFQALGNKCCSRTNYDIEIYSNGKLLQKGKSPLSVSFNYSNLSSGDNEIEIRAINPAKPYLTSSLYMTRTSMGCTWDLGGGGGGDGGCGAGPGGPGGW